ncbi:MAG: DUF1501 domain-containing protein [Planctomycetes bacterium]|nr:DUF1501 domain-containing protein [Planctomycetota bacterium]
MLTLEAGGWNRNCQGWTRREWLRVGALGIGGLSLPALLAARASAAGVEGAVRDKAVVVLFLQGGPTHIETFDPKMTAPAENRAMFGEVKTALPGVTFGSHFPGLARRADQLAIVRSFRHGNSSHGPASELVISGGNSLKAAMGSIYSRVAGTTHPTSGIPRNTIITPKAVGPKYKALGGPPQRVTQVGSLPPAYKAFDPSSGGQIVNDMKLRLSEKRLGDRRSLLGKLDSIRRDIDTGGRLDGADKFQQQAVDVILGGVSKAFDLSQEDPKTIERYDTGKWAIPPKLQKKKKNVPRQSPIALGHQMLLARRLVEAGCGFVTVTSAGWDMHGNALGINDGMPLLGPSVDKAVCAFLDDLKDRGLSEKVLLVITGEFGRTPKINKKGGRDHWGNLCTLALSGGGLNMGQVVGRSSPKAEVPATTPIRPHDLLATIFQLYGIPLKQQIVNFQGRPVYLLEDGQPISELV